MTLPLCNTVPDELEPNDDMRSPGHEQCELDYEELKRQRDEARSHVRMLRAALGAAGGAVIRRAVAPKRYECDACCDEHSHADECFEVSLPGRNELLRVDKRDCLLVTVCDNLPEPDRTYDGDDIPW